MPLRKKGKIKIKKIDDFTADSARIVVQLAPGSSSDKAIDALYAFTDCEINISPNCCVVDDKKPIFSAPSTVSLFLPCHKTVVPPKTTNCFMPSLSFCASLSFLCFFKAASSRNKLPHSAVHI